MDKAMLALRRGLTGRWCRRQDWGRWRAAAPTSLRRGTAPAPPVTRGLASYQNARHELQAAVRALQAQHDVARHASRYDELRQKANELEGALSEDPDIWTLRPKKAHRAMRELAQLQGRLGKVDRLAQSCNDAEAYAGLVLESMEHGHAHADPDALEDCMAEIRAVRADLVAFVDHTLVDPTTADAHDCLLVIEAGNGGLDAKDWVDMLRGMYGAWAARRGFALEEVSVVPDKVAGLRSCILELKASPAPADADNPAAHCPYGWARTEAGVHKLVRFSPFDKAHRRHTSHARVAVVPVEDDRDSGGGARADFPLDKKDLRVDRFRSSGPGGQHANTTDSAVRITHLPTGAVATAQDSRSQHDNLATATARLRNELWAREQRRRMEEAQRFRHPGGGGGEGGGGGGGSDAAGAVDAGAGGWGEHIRQYVLNPQPYVKDQRTNMAVDGSHAVEEVLKGGDIDAFIKGALMRARETVEAAAAATTTAKGSGSGDGAAAARRR